MEAIRQFAQDVGRDNVLYMHLTLVPYLKAADELKTKPTQHSVGSTATNWNSAGHFGLSLRAFHQPRRPRKIALFCNVPADAVIEEKDKDFSIYEVPISLVDNRLDELVVNRLGSAAAHSTFRRGQICCIDSATPVTKFRLRWSESMPNTKTPTSRSTNPSITPDAPPGICSRGPYPE